jgi:hypothetical protein
LVMAVNAAALPHPQPVALKGVFSATVVGMVETPNTTAALATRALLLGGMTGSTDWVAKAIRDWKPSVGELEAAVTDYRAKRWNDRGGSFRPSPPTLCSGTCRPRPGGIGRCQYREPSVRVDTREPVLAQLS